MKWEHDCPEYGQNVEEGKEGEQQRGIDEYNPCMEES